MVVFPRMRSRVINDIGSSHLPYQRVNPKKTTAAVFRGYLQHIGFAIALLKNGLRGLIY